MNKKLLCMKNLLFAIIFCSAAFGANAQSWTTITSDAIGDGSSPNLLDGTMLEYSYNPTTDSLHFRVTVASISASQKTNFGVNVMVNLSGVSKFNFWGTSNTNTWSKLVTTWVSGAPPYAGTIGIADAQGVNTQSWTNLKANNISIVMNEAAKTITLGMKRSDLITNAEMGGKTSISVKAAAAVGSSSMWNDDIYSLTGTMTLSGVTTSVQNVHEQTAQVYPNPAHESVSVVVPTYETINGQVHISDITGRVFALPTTVSSNTALLDIQNLAQGIYWVDVVTNNGNHYTQKVVVIE